ncbi:MAG: type II secretion system F family protein [Candidatus Sumerlaeota bacterium]|nr:type II secretion system F family protein [Candidatus Sumerlaeota bacterium]
MPQFEYLARTTQGRVITGRTEAANQSVVARLLREKGLTPTSIEEGSLVAAAVRAKPQKQKRGRIKLEDLVIFSRQFATMIRAGLPLIEVLSILGDQSDKAQMKATLRQIEKDVQGGASLTEALQKHPRVFNLFFLSMVRAGEAAGMLDAILDQVATYLEKTAALQRKIKSAVMYPSVVSCVAMCITTFLLVKVVPVFEDIFSELGGDLPIPTQITLGLSRAIQHNYLIITLGIAGVVIGLWQAKKTAGGRLAIDKFKLKMPIFGPLFLKVAVARFSRTLGTLIKSGVNILSALDIVAKTANNVIVEQAVYRTRTSIQSGESIARPLTESGVFPPMVTRMIDVGERTGALESMLTKIADFYEDQVDNTVAGLTSLIEPVLIVFLGVVVGFIVISMFMPLFKMIEMIDKK